MIKTHKKNGKSKAKSYGLKSLFAKDNNILVATSGKKNELIVEQVIDNDTKLQVKMVDDPKFNVKALEKQVNLKSTVGNANTDVNNPYFNKNNKKIGSDYLGIKDKLENEFFGQTYNDNIHIQIAYKLLDIRKIFAKHMNNVIYSINNLQDHFVDDEVQDIAGQIIYINELSSLKPEHLAKDKYLIDNLLEYSRYFDYVFEKKKKPLSEESEVTKIEKLEVNESTGVSLHCTVKKIIDIENYKLVIFNANKTSFAYRTFNNSFQEKDIVCINGNITRTFDKFNAKKKKCEKKFNVDRNARIEILNDYEMEYADNTYEYNYNVLRVISMFRQFAYHNKKEYSSIIYNIDKNESIDDLLDLSNEAFASAMSLFNKKFNENCSKNIFLIAAIMTGDRTSSLEKEDIASIYKNYYRYVLRKENKNVGFNLKKIRINIFDKYIKDSGNNEVVLNNEKSKVNTLIDYFIFDYYTKNSEIVEDVIARLQKSNNDDEKEQIYLDVTKEFIDKNKALFDNIINTVHKYIAEDLKDYIKDNELCTIEDTITVSSFAKMVYILTKFLDVKEANDLLTSLINSFQNISSLTFALNDPSDFDQYVKNKEFAIYSKEYDLLNNLESNEIANELIIVKNLANMKNQLQKADPKNASDKVSKLLYRNAVNAFKDKNDEISDEELELILKDFSTNKNNKGKDKKRGTAGSKIRNFMINNVLNNRRFYYITKYYDTRKCRAIIQNTYLLKFILEKKDNKGNYVITLDQMKRYYKTITGEESDNRKEMMNTLIEKLQMVSYDSISQKGQVLVDAKDNMEAESLKSLVSLYLMICYVIVKGIVNVNSIFALGYSAFERDLYYIKDIDFEDKKSKLNWFCLVEDFINRESYKKNHKYLANELEISKNLIDPNIYLQLRNKIDHMNLCTSFIDYIDKMGYVNSYYEIFQYVLQIYLARELYNPNNNKKPYPVLVENEVKVIEHKTFNKNLNKYLFMPFAYNMARYKNLTIADLFNDKYPSECELVDGHVVKKELTEW